MILLRNKKYRFEETEEVNYWKSTSDMLAALLLIVMLIMMVILINLFDKQHELNEYTSNNEYDYLQYSDPWPGDTTYSGDGRYDTYSWDHSGGGGGAYEEVPKNDHTGDYDQPESIYEYEEGADRAAVYVVVKDAETNSVILNENIGFRLYDKDGVIQTLSTYYPVKTTYDTYSTSESGSFYIPEKIELGTYTLRQTTDVTGYDREFRTEFTVDDNYTWKEPYVVTISLSPSRNKVKLTLTDSRTGIGIQGAVFNVIANEDIITADGTRRLAKDDIADTITTDINGYAESKELYLGEYALEEIQTPFGYAAIFVTEPLKIGKKDEPSNAKVAIQNEMTEVKLYLHDELQENKLLSGAVFSLTAENVEEKVYETSFNGQIYITGLEKNTNYTLRQLSFEPGYDTTSKPVEFYVDNNGYIEGNTSLELNVKNRIIRIEIKTVDTILAKTVEKIPVVMYDESGKLVDQWVSEKAPHYIEGIQPGIYYLSAGDEQSEMTQIDVLSTASVQSFSVRQMTAQSWIIIALAVLAGIAVIAVLIVSLVKRRIY